MADRDRSHWEAYNEHQAGRAVRPLLTEALAHTGPGTGRVAVDLGCGAGVESLHLVQAGWTVHALDADEAALRRLDGLGGPRLHTQVVDLDHLDALPTADLVYSGYALPFTSDDRFHRTWTTVRAALAPGAVVAVNLFGTKDSWAGSGTGTYLTELEVRSLVDGLELLHLHEEDEDGPAFSGPKHWHVFDVIARRGHEGPTPVRGGRPASPGGRR